LQPGADEASHGEIGVTEVEWRVGRQGGPPAEHGDGGLDIRRPHPQVGRLQIRPASLQVSAGVLADVGGEYLEDNQAVLAIVGLFGDLFQPVDTTEPQLQFPAAELIDGVGEPLGDLALTGQNKLLAELLSVDPKPLSIVLQPQPANGNAEQGEQTDCPLHDGSTGAVGGGGALLGGKFSNIGVMSDQPSRHHEGPDDEKYNNQGCRSCNGQTSPAREHCP
jgi:hypothetical protein